MSSCELLIKVNDPREWSINDIVRNNDFPKRSEDLEKIAKRVEHDIPLDAESLFDSYLVKEFVYLIVTIQKKDVTIVSPPSRSPVCSTQLDFRWCSTLILSEEIRLVRICWPYSVVPTRY